MNGANDSLETELAALRPHAPSPEVRRRVADRLTSSARSRSRRRWGVALVGGLAAACLAAVVLLGRGNRRDGPPVRPDVLSHPAPAPAVEDGLPTLQAYVRALARSPEALDALLDQHAARAPERERQPAPVYAFTRSEANLHN